MSSRTQRNHSRNSSTGSGSIHQDSPAASGPPINMIPDTPSSIVNPGSDDEDSDGRSQSQLSYKERRREAHTQAEQKRRDAIKKGYEYLQELVPTISSEIESSNAKASKAVVLQKAIDYIQHVETQKKNQEGDLNCLKKELAALEIMRDNYEQLVKAHQSSTAVSSGDHGDDGIFVPTEVKFRVFQMLMDSLFMTFNDKVGMNSFQDLSRGVISWLEEECTPQSLQEMMINIIEQVKREAHGGQLGLTDTGNAGVSGSSSKHHIQL